jgi:hypothetical protein
LQKLENYVSQIRLASEGPMNSTKLNFTFLKTVNA